MQTILFIVYIVAIAYNLFIGFISVIIFFLECKTEALNREIKQYEIINKTLQEKYDHLSRPRPYEVKIINAHFDELQKIVDMCDDRIQYSTVKPQSN